MREEVVRYGVWVEGIFYPTDGWFANVFRAGRDRHTFNLNTRLWAETTVPRSIFCRVVTKDTKLVGTGAN